MKSTHKYIANKIDQDSSGGVLFPSDFRGLGSEAAIKMSLSRHVAGGKLNRLAHGVYIKNDKNGNTPQPSLEIIADAISKKEGFS